MLLLLNKDLIVNSCFTYNMEDCVVCGEIALYKCQPCTVSFCEEHKSVHERNKNKPHIFESIKPKFDPAKYAKIAESLVTKIKELETFKSRIILETKTLINKIEELRTKCIKTADAKAKSYIALLKQFQNPAAFEDLSAIENQLNTFVCHDLPFPSIQEIQNFYNYDFFKNQSVSPKQNRLTEIPDERLEELKSMPIDRITKVLAEEYSLFMEGHSEIIYCVKALVITNT